ncbi:hypothetical protein HER10_EVM0011584 [Colletotrichum scovillei]|uniref:Ketoreductase domain-containing protein n=2 Tax=Colletotrichum acutatum species complex TaxID=2707335 RepID=A0A9P7QWA9_9PEZI|nr:uncharacterized protein HER10_EVM0011584 [Colletotrichum scovillei]KAF4784720.1 hypothetical protein HER10_EVM0011584 [Colletotrichum scovillei]KAG7044644.1 hypothetical protein JMJ77_0004106 [Colletotrichum scovillei]KAG7049353.1 hypothetical protein JMJ78_0013336 [Colletotrichum scovillei]KAG7064098.1 hypothetical protein JMJ76_0007146 [Colletotrichum scovillei]
MTSPASKTWLITGCTSGFGEALVRKLMAEGDNVIATGRGGAEARLAHLRDSTTAARFRIMELDVGAASEAEIRTKAAEAWGYFEGGVDVVVNNAGYIVSGLVEELTQEEMEASFRTNFHGPLNVTRAFLPMMRERGTGTLVYVSSQAAWHVEVGAGAYSASKFALEGAVETLSKELSILAPNIKVIIIEPGFFRTKVFDNISNVPARIPEFAEFNAAIRAGAEALPGTEPGDPEKAVARIAELVRGDGMVKEGDGGGREVPLRVALGSDGWERIRDKCVGVLEGLRAWEDVARSTDF